MILKMSDEEKRIIGDRIREIREIREENKLSVRDFGDMLKCSGANVCRYENGDVENIPISRIKLISQKFGVNALWLLGMSNDKRG